MTDLELMRLRMLIAQSSAAGAARHAEVMSEFMDIQTALLDEYRQFLPEGYELPAAIREKIDAITDRIAP